MIIAGILIGVLVIAWIWIGSVIFWRIGFKELDRILGTKVLNYKLKEKKDDNKENK